MSTSTLKPDYNFKYFLMLMQSAMNLTPVKKAEEPVNWQTLYDIAVDHSLAGMLYFAIEKLPEADKPKGDFMPYLAQMYREQIVTDLNLSLETERMLQLLNSEGIKCMPVKGIITKSDYPQSHLRSMSDVDILFEFKDHLKIQEVFLREGYKKEGIGEKDVSYRKAEILHFEMHHTLVKETSPACIYFSKVWDRAVYSNGSIAKMSLEDTYIYMLEHIANHIGAGGAGIRMYMDVYLFNLKHRNELDRVYVNKILDEILLRDFEKQTLRICCNWFSGEEEIDYRSPAAEFILNSCTYGRTKVYYLADALRGDNAGSSSAKNGMKRVLGNMFPALRWMRLRFKAVNRFVWLYPVFVPVHWVDRLIVKRNVKTKNIGNFFISANSAEAQQLKSVYNAFGLEKRI